MQINNFNSEKFIETTGRTQVEINESATTDTPNNFVDNEKAIYNTKVVSVYQKALATTYVCPDCSNEVTPDQEDLVDCTCGLTSTRDSCIVNDKLIVFEKNEKLIKINLVTTEGLLHSC